MKTRARQRTRGSPTPGLTGFARRLWSAWRDLNLPTTDAGVILAASGGADSTALLLGVDELVTARKLSLSLTVAHLDHGLRKTSKADASWVIALAKELGYRSVKRGVDVQKRATETGDNLEQAARRTRYEFLLTAATRARADLVLTAHTLDDQAETVLLRLLRGSAAEGLSGIEGVRPLAIGSEIQLARPLLSWARHADSENYCRARQVEFRLDEMNEDERFARVKVRKQLLPLMETFNHKIVDALARTANLLREDADALNDEAVQLLALAEPSFGANSDETERASLNVRVMIDAPAAVRRRALRLWLEREHGHLRRLEMVHLLAIDRLLMGDRGGVAQLPDGRGVLRKQGKLQLNGLTGRKKG